MTVTLLNYRYITDLTVTFFVLYDRSDRSYRLIDWDCAMTVASAAGRLPGRARNQSSSCAIDQPRVPINVWGEVVAHAPHSACTL